jgi:hypothetical protein
MKCSTQYINDANAENTEQREGNKNTHLQWLPVMMRLRINNVNNNLSHTNSTEL